MLKFYIVRHIRGADQPITAEMFRLIQRYIRFMEQIFQCYGILREAGQAKARSGLAGHWAGWWLKCCLLDSRTDALGDDLRLRCIGFGAADHHFFAAELPYNIVIAYCCAKKVCHPSKRRLSRKTTVS